MALRRSMPLSVNDEEKHAFLSPSDDYTNDNFHEHRRLGWLKQRWRVLHAKLPTVHSTRRPLSHVVIAILLFTFTLFLLANTIFPSFGQRDASQSDEPPPSTLAFSLHELSRVWEWEILSGHYPTRRKVPGQLERHLEPKHSPRHYLDIETVTPYPTRPRPGSAADLDIIMDFCDFSTQKYVRDCLDFLKAGAGLGRHSGWRTTPPYVFVERDAPALRVSPRRVSEDFSLPLGPTARPRMEQTEYGRCDPSRPRIFHSLWMGPLTDKGYVSLLSFLYTQNLGLHYAGVTNHTQLGGACQPQLWVWMDLSSATAMPPSNASALLDEQLKSNVWSAPFLHPRFRRHIQFKLWNATEQLDATPEVKDNWREFPFLVSQGYTITPSDGEKRNGAVLSDLARFILLQRYGGIYIDGDVIFLRDWEELWGWRGAFSYRWSYHDNYNTAILRMHKGSALGSFILQTAARNEWDFHPTTITRYLKDAFSTDLLFRLPDALFDPNWLHTEGKQREKPPVPYLDVFEYFSVPKHAAPPPKTRPFDAFFRGAFGYHSHLTLSTPFDPTRNWPDLNIRSGEERSSQEHEDSDEELPWSAVLKRTFEAYLREEQPNMYGEYIQ